MKVYFIGAGPGDPELLTLRGKRLIEQSPVIVYAGSLVSTEILKFAKNARATYNSAEMELGELREVYEQALKYNHDVARIHSGDPSIYGAINEQFAVLEELQIEYEVVPGVSSFQAAAAALKTEFTAPEICQTITLSRVAGRTPVPAKEELELIAAPQPTLVLFLSILQLKSIIERLLKIYPPKTPVAVLSRLSWPDEAIFKGELNTILEIMDGANIKNSALIVVSESLNNNTNFSRLYAAEFAHGFRNKKESSGE